MGFLQPWRLVLIHGYNLGNFYIMVAQLFLYGTYVRPGRQ